MAKRKKEEGSKEILARVMIGRPDKYKSGIVVYKAVCPKCYDTNTVFVYPKGKCLNQKTCCHFKEVGNHCMVFDKKALIKFAKQPKTIPFNSLFGEMIPKRKTRSVGKDGVGENGRVS